MKILITTDTYYPHVNGASYFTQRLAYYLQAKGHIVAVIAPSQSLSNTKGKVNDIFVFGIRSLPVFLYHGFRFSPPIYIKHHIKTIVEEFKPDVIHLQGHFFISRTVLKVANTKNIRVVATNHFMPENLVHYIPLPSFIKKSIKEWAWRDFAKIFNEVHQVSTPTESAAQLIRHRLRTPVKPISCGIDLSRFKPNKNGDYLLERYQIPKQPILLYVGRLDKEKNIDLVIQALARVLPHVHLHFVIAGTGKERASLEKLSEKLSIRQMVTFTGFVPDDDLANLYTIASCFVVAGTAELQSIVTMEAMASGLPVIAVRAVALPELVHDRQNGFLFEAGDVAGLAEKIITIFSDQHLMEQMGEKSLEFIVKHDIKKTISLFEDLYKTNETP